MGGLRFDKKAIRWVKYRYLCLTNRKAIRIFINCIRLMFQGLKALIFRSFDGATGWRILGPCPGRESLCTAYLSDFGRDVADFMGDYP